VWLVLPVAVWLAWTRREMAGLARRSALLAGPLLVGLGWLCYAIGDIQLYQSVWHFGAILIVVGCMTSVLGGGVLLRYWPAFVVLLFLIPVPGIVRQQISMPLQTVTAQITGVLLETLGTPVVLSGNVLIVNEVPVGIAEACNGVRMVFALTLVCFLYAFSSEMSNLARFVVLLSSPLVAIGANVCRLVPTVYLFGYADAETAEQFHTVSGWAMMPAALFFFMGAGAVVRWVSEGGEQQEETVPEAVVQGVGG
jgi:exosortase